MSNPDQASASLSSLPSLSSLSSVLSGMTFEQQSVLHKAFTVMWRKIAPMKRFTSSAGVLHLFWILDDEMKRRDISPRNLTYLTYLYTLSECGSRWIDAPSLYSLDICPITKLMWAQCGSWSYQHGYTLHSYRNPEHPHITYQLHGNRYIKLSDAGIALIKDIERSLYKRSLETAKITLFGNKKRPPFKDDLQNSR